MIRTQINLPDKIHAAAKRLAETRETSLAEVIRRALEEHFERHSSALESQGQWTFPKGRPMGIKDNIDWSKAKDDLYVRDPFKSTEDQ